MIFVKKMGRLLCIFVLFIAAASGRQEIGEYDKTMDVIASGNAETPVIISYPHRNTNNPFRVNVFSIFATAEFPVIVVVRQQRRVMSWQIPILVESSKSTEKFPREFRNTSRTLCFDTEETIQKYNKRYGIFKWKDMRKRNFTVSISTASPLDIVVKVRVEEAKNFFIVGDQKYETTFSPGEPTYFSYNFPPNLIKNDIKTVLIHVQSEDSTCFLVSVQPKTCPVRDLNEDITFEGKFQSVDTKGGLAISKASFPKGFFLVFVAMGNNMLCSQENSLLPQPLARKTFSIDQSTNVIFEIQTGKTVQEYIAATMMVLWSCIGGCLLFVVITILYYHFGRYKGVAPENEEPLNTPDYTGDTTEPDSIIQKSEHYVADFVKRGDRNKKRALNYTYHILNIAIFYGIPVIQLMISYQRAVNISGNLDLCYHNFHCAQPYYFTDFNHIYSNIGYILFGILFICITFFRSMKMHNKAGCGIPKFHGLYYSMGMALIFEGFLSACYHICPNQSNFQFDTSFMYVMAILIMVKLYQNRHPDINASAYTTFSVLGIAVLIAMFGILYNSLAIMIIFILSYVLLCFYMAFKIYFFGQVGKGWHLIYEAYKNNDPKLDLLKPIRVGQFILITIANMCNIAIAITGIVLYPNQVDFGTFLLGILMFNAIMYAIFYIVMKLLCRERICIETTMYGLLSLVAWCAGAYFFVNAATLSSLTPAASRQLNQECILMDFYDTHDIWHLLSAPALFFSFMFLQTLDDDLFDKPQNKILAF